MLTIYQLTFEPYTGMSDLMMSMVSDVVMKDITKAMMTSPHVIHTIPNSFECIARGTRSPYLTHSIEQTRILTLTDDVEMFKLERKKNLFA